MAIPDVSKTVRRVQAIIYEVEKHPDLDLMKFVVPPLVDIVWYNPDGAYSKAMRKIHTIFNLGKTVVQNQLVRVHGNRIGVVEDATNRTGIILGVDKSEQQNADFSSYPNNAFMLYQADERNTTIMDLKTTQIELDDYTWEAFIKEVESLCGNKNHAKASYSKERDILLSSIHRHINTMTKSQRKQLNKINPSLAAHGHPSLAAHGLVTHGMVDNDLFT